MAEVHERTGAGARASRTLGRTRLKDAFGYAWAGVAYVWRSEPNFRVEVVVGGLALLLAFALRAALAPILLCCALVLSLEALNSAVEATVDLVSPKPHPLAKRAKDAAAGAVLLASLLSVFVGLVVLGPPLWEWIV